jgi:UDP-N-acetylmuramoylalanine--D-glutamate ligase
MEELIRKVCQGKKVAVLGFGREGRSTYSLLRSCLPGQSITIMDSDKSLFNDPISQDPFVLLKLGNDIYKSLNDFDIIIKAPGVPARVFPPDFDFKKVHSQTSLFLEKFHRQVIGVTGTKGKSTTASLIHHVISESGKHAHLVGNIGLPPFDVLGEIRHDTVIVMELSSHQLQFLTRSPHISILLNIFQEHLDHYSSYEEYQQAKMNIGRYQDEDDYFIYCEDHELLQYLIGSMSVPHICLPYSYLSEPKSGIYRENENVILQSGTAKQIIYSNKSAPPLKGEHNYGNIMAAAAACFLTGIPEDQISAGVRTFKGLEHRIEYVDTVDGIRFYNDSIATIPEATIAAVKTLQDVDTLILGGYDRGIDYAILYSFLASSGIRNIIFIGNAGMRMKSEMETAGISLPGSFTANDYDEVVAIARKVTRKEKICLLSPAASSYDMFKNFEHRGNIYKKNVRS